MLQFLRSLGGEGGCSAQLSNAAPTVAALPFRCQFEDFVNGVVLLVRPQFDTGDQQLVNGRQKARIDCSWITNLLDCAQHTETPQQLAGKCSHVGPALLLHDEFSIEWSEFRAGAQNTEFGRCAIRGRDGSVPENPYSYRCPEPFPIFVC